MLDVALKVINKIEENGFKAYIVGGFVRDYLLGIDSNDIDICTNATPHDICNIFTNSWLSNECYGSVIVSLKNYNFEITTFRREITYLNNRKPIEIEYIDDLLTDLKRRDFKINTICMDKDKNIIDLLDGKLDLSKQEVNCVGDSYQKFNEDSLRILRAIRFATILNFKLSSSVKDAIRNTKSNLKTLSYNRKKEELNKIFTSINVRYGVKLLIELGLDKELEIDKLSNISNFDDLMGVWTQLNVDSIYPFTKNELSIMKDIRMAINLDISSNLVLYKYGLYVCSVVAAIKGIDKKIITNNYNKLPIKSRDDININGSDIIEILKIEPGEIIKDIMNDIEDKIINMKLNNEKEELLKYILDNYK